MKPFVIYAEKNSVNVTMTKAEFEKYIKEAYNGGYEDGYQVGKASTNWNTINTRDYPTSIPVYYGTGTPAPLDPTKITCEAHNAVE